MAECQTGFDVVLEGWDNTNNTGNFSLPVEAVLVELGLELSGALEVLSVEGVNCLAGNACGSGGGCVSWTGSTVRYEWCAAAGSAGALWTGLLFRVRLDGLNGCLEGVLADAVSLRIVGLGGDCALSLDGSDMSFPQCSACNFCGDVRLRLGPPTVGPGLCQTGFSVWAENLGAQALSYDDLSVKLELDLTPDISITGVLPSLCPQNSACPLSPGGCWSIGGTSVEYGFCVPGMALAVGSTHLFDVVLSGEGCVQGVTVMEAELTPAARATCTMQEDAQDLTLPSCSVCPGERTLSGDVLMEDGEPVTEVQLSIQDVNSPDPNDCDPDDPLDCQQSAMTDCTGAYGVSFVCNTDNYFGVAASKNCNWLNGVTTFDMVLIQRHILGTQLLDSPYKLIAADADNSSTVTTFDLAEIRRLILHRIEQFSKNTSWRFVPADVSLSYPQDPAIVPMFPNCGNVDMSGGDSEQDFVAVKVGDVNNSAVGCLPCSEGSGSMLVGERLSGDRVLRLEAQGRGAREGEELELSFRLRGFEGLAAVQAGLHFDAQRLRFEGLGTLSRWVRSYDFGLSEASQGRIRWLWVSPDGENAELPPEEVLFTLRFRVLEGTAEGATAVRLSDAVLPCVAYDAAGGAYRVQGGAGVLSQRTSSGTALPGSFRLRALPNPFRNGLRLEVWMPQAGRFRIRVLDAAGRTVQELERRLPAGRHELELEGSDRWPAGVYWYRVEAPERLAGKWVKQR